MCVIASQSDINQVNIDTQSVCVIFLYCRQVHKRMKAVQKICKKVSGIYAERIKAKTHQHSVRCVKTLAPPYFL